MTAARSTTALRAYTLFAALATAACRPPASHEPATTPAPPASPPATGAPAPAAPGAPEPARDAATAPAPPLDFVERYMGGAHAGDRVPLVVALHGLGDSPDVFVTLFDALPFPARVVVPRAPLPWPTGSAWFGMRGSAGWDTVAPGMRAAADRLVADVPRWVAAQPTCGAPLVMGFSQGGMLAFALAARRPSPAGAAFPLGGLLPAALGPASAAGPGERPRIVAFHGDADPRVSVTDARATVERFRAHGYDATLHEYPGVGHAVPREMAAQLFAEMRAAAHAAGCAP